MSFARTLDDIEKLGAPVVVLTMVLTFATMAFLLVRETTAPFAVTAPRAVPSYQAAEDEAPSVSVAAYQGPEDRGAGQLPACATPPPETSPAPTQGVPREPRAPSMDTGEQRVFKSRKALETIDARELLRRAGAPQ